MVNGPFFKKKKRNVDCSHHFRGIPLGAKPRDLWCKLFLEQHHVGQTVQSDGIMFGRGHHPGRGEVRRHAHGTLELRHAAPQSVGEHLARERGEITCNSRCRVWKKKIRDILSVLHYIISIKVPLAPPLWLSLRRAAGSHGENADCTPLGLAQRASGGAHPAGCCRRRSQTAESSMHSRQSSLRSST